MTCEVVPEWGVLPTPVIISVVSVLKKLYRWRRDGPTLRALNKHWCEEISLCITELRPVKKIEFVPEDLRGFSKFGNLQILDLSPFLKSLSSSYPTKLVHSLDSLRNIRSLREIEISGSMAYVLEALSPECFRSLTSIKFDHARFHRHEKFPLLSSVPIQNACFVLHKPGEWFYLPWIDSLKSLTIWTRRLPSYFIETVTTLTCLESLCVASLRKHNDIVIEKFELLSNMKSLTSLEVPDFHFPSTAWLTELTRLKRLSLNIEDFAWQKIEAWEHLIELRSLTSLSVPTSPKEHHLTSFLEAVKDIRCLELSHVPAMNTDIVASFSQLTKLTIEKITSFPICKALSLPFLVECSIYDASSFDHVEDLDTASWSQNLVVLELNIGLTEAQIYEISLIRGLRKFCWYSRWCISDVRLSELWRLRSLKELCVHQVCWRDHLDLNPCFQKLVENLELFGIINLLKGNSVIRWIKSKSPFTRLAFTAEEFRTLSTIGQKMDGIKNYYL